MLSSMSGNTLGNSIRNERVAPIEDKMMKNWLR